MTTPSTITPKLFQVVVEDKRDPSHNKITITTVTNNTNSFITDNLRYSNQSKIALIMQSFKQTTF